MTLAAARDSEVHRLMRARSERSSRRSLEAARHTETARLLQDREGRAFGRRRRATRCARAFAAGAHRAARVLFDERIVTKAPPPHVAPQAPDFSLELQGGSAPQGEPSPPPADNVFEAPTKTSPAALDAWMKAFMQHWGIRAATLAVTRRGKLVFASGYTWAEPDYPKTEPDSRCRIWSISKTITAIAIMQLYDEQRLDMTSSIQDPGMLELRELEGTPPAPDQAWKTVTVSRLLCHVTGLPIPIRSRRRS